jgi:hypothetical protein
VLALCALGAAIATLVLAASAHAYYSVNYCGGYASICDSRLADIARFGGSGFNNWRNSDAINYDTYADICTGLVESNLSTYRGSVCATNPATFEARLCLSGSTPPTAGVAWTRDTESDLLAAHVDDSTSCI